MGQRRSDSERVPRRARLEELDDTRRPVRGIGRLLGGTEVRPPTLTVGEECVRAHLADS